MTLALFLKEKRWMLVPPFILFCLIYTPVFPGMVSIWMDDPNYSHGFLVPLISLWFAWKRWPELKDCPVEPSGAGFILLLAGMMLLAGGLAIDELYTSRVSCIAILAGIIQVLFGSRVLRLLALPLCFLLFMVPLPYTLYDALALPLRGFVSILATGGLKLCGLPVLREGNMIILPNISLEVVEACSGMRSLVSLIALGTAYAFLLVKGTWRKVALIISTIPVAVFTNVLRVFITGVLARHFGAVAAEGFFHDFAGLAVFVVAMILTALIGWLLMKIPFHERENKGNGGA